ncbi:GH22463 [Drosophila grimshawi]|uniref:GH22463 n=1 Tax=Drosophila grimshawi TaxID=7222 RepID=B4JSI2_DROGR|nr:GH22463 [Drosophila grimshawi]
MNQTLDFVCPDDCFKLKSYPSTFDDRSWAAGETKKSRFVSDLVSCNIPLNIDDRASYDDGESQNGQRGPAGRQEAGQSLGNSGDMIPNCRDQKGRRCPRLNQRPYGRVRCGLRRRAPDN